MGGAAVVSNRDGRRHIVVLCVSDAPSCGLAAGSAPRFRSWTSIFDGVRTTVMSLPLALVRFERVRPRRQIVHVCPKSRR